MALQLGRHHFHVADRIGGLPEGFRRAIQVLGQSPQAQRFQQAAQAPGGDAQIVQRFRVGALDDPGIGMHDLDFEAGNGANHGCGESHTADSRNWGPKSRTCC
ncbi:TPA: hypothetical protein SL842_004263, partial [Pseudomonas aeruginosa]|nr:hypothetical protein [Pseudomonas aeruginosa]